MKFNLTNRINQQFFAFYFVFCIAFISFILLTRIIYDTYDKIRLVVISSELIEIAPGQSTYLNRYYTPTDSITYYSLKNFKQTPGDTLWVIKKTLHGGY